MTTTRPLLTTVPPAAEAVPATRVAVTWTPEDATKGGGEDSVVAPTRGPGFPAAEAEASPASRPGTAFQLGPESRSGTAPPRVAAAATRGAGPAPRPRSGMQVSRPRRYPPIKRAVDAVVAGTALVVLAPVIGAVWAAVRVRLGKPAFFFQERVTVGGRRFRLRKFRTMLPVDPDRGWVTDDDRLTPFGTWLRASSLDELPSLWNILVGDMSIVGPRPLPTRYLSIYSPAQLGRHAVRAGLTGLAQVSGRNNVPWDERFDLDLRYVRLMGPLLDLTIVARTVRTVLSGDGVAEGDLATSTEFPGPLRTPRLRFVPSADARGCGSGRSSPAGATGAEAVHGGGPDGGAHPGSEVAGLFWEARTPEDTRVATCGLVPQTGAGMGAGAGPEEVLADLTVTGFDRTTGPDMAEDVAMLLVNRARAADCTHARIALGPEDAGLRSAFLALGFEPTVSSDGPCAGPADHSYAGPADPAGAGRADHTDAGPADYAGAGPADHRTDPSLLTADIRCLDDPLTAGAGR
ncbi:sugar transferase [Brevibacterium yomogidense]|uniref:sugar transferase n=1 Tax=Brevibacterium yomogidense TaxID=946573 RepID=UPI001E4D0F18|nr:sugar transferase [Brevibacterium yomogidense]